MYIFTSRSLIYSIGNFINQKEYPNIKKMYINDNIEILFVKSSEIITFARKGLSKIKGNLFYYLVTAM